MLHYLLSLLTTFSLLAQENQEHLKIEIEKDLYLLERAPTEEKSSIQLRLAQNYAKDQDSEKAFTLFLQSIERAPTTPYSALQEDALYQEALKLYLSPQGSTKEKATKIVEDYENICQNSPLGFIVAAAKANLKQYEEFFTLFYPCYLRYSDHFLVHKTKALLYHKLWQGAKLPHSRQLYRKKVIEHLQMAIERYPKDSSLYKMAITFSEGEERSRFVELSLDHLVKGDIISARNDVLFFVKAGVDCKKIDQTKAFIAYLRRRCKYSRVVEMAQQIIEEKEEKSV